MDIVERLRKGTSLDCIAADEIERLRSELSRITKEKDAAISALETALPYVEQSVAEIHDALDGYKPHIHKQADMDLAEVRSAIAK